MLKVVNVKHYSCLPLVDWLRYIDIVQRGMPGLNFWHILNDFSVFLVGICQNAFLAVWVLDRGVLKALVVSMLRLFLDTWVWGIGLSLLFFLAVTRATDIATKVHRIFFFGFLTVLMLLLDQILSHFNLYPLLRFGFLLSQHGLPFLIQLVEIELINFRVLSHGEVFWNLKSLWAELDIGTL